MSEFACIVKFMSEFLVLKQSAKKLILQSHNYFIIHFHATKCKFCLKIHIFS